MSPPKRAKSSRAPNDDLTVTVQSFGPTPEKIQALAQSIPRHQAIQKELSGTRSRLLRVDLLDPVEETKSGRPQPPDRFQATFVDYTNNRTLFATGRLGNTRTLSITESALQPRPSDEVVQVALKPSRVTVWVAGR